jgi:NADPH-dependent 2,4-dienoyl-CoA reductase/sulfur reductase-like enzyme
MTEKRLVVVGGGAGGMSAAAKARRQNRDLQIIAYEKGGFVSFGACGLPYLIQGVIKDHNALIARTPAQFAEQGIEVHIHHQVTEIDPAKGHVKVRDLDAQGSEQVIPFDYLLLGTGGTPLRPPIPGLDLEGVFTLRSIEDGLAIRRFIAEQKPQRAAIVGGGYIGLEMAEALHAHGMAVTVLEMLSQVLPNFDADMAALIAQELENQGVALYTGHGAEGLDGSAGRVRAVAAGEEFPVDMVILGAGIRPGVSLARQAGIALGPTGAVAVDGQMRTNLEGIYAAGDVAEAHHLVTGKPAYIPLGTTANKQGRTAGENIGGGQAVFSGVVGTAVVKVFDSHAARTGLTEREAKKEGFDALAVTIKQGSRAHYYPGSTPLHVKLVFERQSGRLLGGQIVGRDEVAKRVDVIAAALHAGWNVDDFSRLDLSYAPPFSPVWDALLIAANVGLAAWEEGKA